MFAVAVQQPERDKNAGRGVPEVFCMAKVHQVLVKFQLSIVTNKKIEP